VVTTNKDLAPAGGKEKGGSRWFAQTAQPHNRRLAPGDVPPRWWLVVVLKRLNAPRSPLPTPVKRLPVDFAQVLRYDVSCPPVLPLPFISPSCQRRLPFYINK
jgi:hypothetical protein